MHGEQQGVLCSCPGRGSKEKFDAASSGQSPQELKGESDSNHEEKEAPSESPAGISPLHQPDNNFLHQTQYVTA